MEEKLTCRSIKDKIYTYINNIFEMKKGFKIIDDIEKKLSLLNDFNNVYSQVYDNIREEYCKNSNRNQLCVRGIIDEVEETIRYLNNYIYELNEMFGEKIYKYKHFENYSKTENDKRRKKYFNHENIIETMKHFAKIRRDAFLRISENILGKIENIEKIFEDDPEYLKP